MNTMATSSQKRGAGIRWVRILPLLLALAVVAVFRCEPRWLQMWIAAGLIWLGCKWAMAEGDLALEQAPLVARLLWWGWPGMDTKPFHGRVDASPVRWADIAQGLAWMSVGGLLFLEAAPRLAADHGLAAGWIAWGAIILTLHFGLFHIMAALLRKTGIAVEPIMRNPFAAETLAGFWGRRWNLAFQQVAHRLLFRPFAGLIGGHGAILLVFVVSGLVHELVITIPAGGGYGLPTLYFLIQGLALILEKTPLARAAGLGSGWKGRAFTLVAVLAPVPALFPPQFFRTVIVPFVAAVSSLLS